jgi:hypothetical protein
VLLPILECLTGNPLAPVVNCGVLPYFTIILLFLTFLLSLHFISFHFISLHVPSNTHSTTVSSCRSLLVACDSQKTIRLGVCQYTANCRRTAHPETVFFGACTFLVRLLYDYAPISFHPYPTPQYVFRLLSHWHPPSVPSSPFLSVGHHLVRPAPTPPTAFPRSAYSWP